MSGHSKWKTIKRQKGVADNKRGQIFTKLSTIITLAVKQGGGVSDPNSNFKLRLAVDRARAANMPKENIQRAIDRAQGSGADQMQELMYEGFAPGGVAMLVETATDNKQRTVSSVKNIIEKSGGAMGSTGSVSYLFARRGEIVVKKNGKSFDELFEIGIDDGALDVEEEGDSVFFYVEPQNLENTRKSLISRGIEIESAELLFLPTTYTEADENFKEKIMDLVEKLEELDDVQQVYTNLQV